MTTSTASSARQVILDESQVSPKISQTLIASNDGVGIRVEGGELNVIEYAKLIFTGPCPGETKKKPFKGRFYYPALFNKTPKPGVEFKKVILKNFTSGEIKEKKFPDKKGLPGISDDFKVRWDKDLKLVNGENQIFYSFKVKQDGKERIIDGGSFIVNVTTKNITTNRGAVTRSEIVCEDESLTVAKCETRTVTKVQKVCNYGGFFSRVKVLETTYKDSNSVFGDGDSNQNDTGIDFGVDGLDEGSYDPREWES